LRPVLFDIHLFSRDFALHTYGVAIAAAFLIAIFVGTRTAARTGEDPDKVRDLCFWLLVSSLIGARLVFIATNVPDYVRLCREEHDCFRALRVWEGGLVFYGGFFAALAVAVYYTRRHAMNFWRTADILAPSVALGHFFGRLGCFAAGCCWGKECDRPWAVTFRNPDAHELTGVPLNVPLHPTQLYESLAEFIIFWILYTRFARPHRDGAIIGLYLILYSGVRFVVEFFRNHEQALTIGLSLTQWISMGTLLIGIWLMFNRPRQTAVA
jgi:phosphatidylglycerol---prolipoprotein diacylglyceryl transferase